MSYRRFLIAALVSLAALTVGAAPALADSTGYHNNPNASVSGQCHGAFGAFSHHFAFTSFIPPVDAHQDFGQHGGGSASNPNAEMSEASDLVC